MATCSLHNSIPTTYLASILLHKSICRELNSTADLKIMAFFMKEFEHLKLQLEDIKRATNNFDKTKVIGSGGFGEVYEGEVSDPNGTKSMVAVKRLDRKFGQGDPEFWKEVIMLSRYKHENLISLLGFCNEGRERILIYEHASNGSLDRYIHTTTLTWSQRIKICLDAARGLSFLHEDKGTHERVLHRDIKSSNILLDRNWNAKVSDMGLSKVGPANQQHTALFTNIVGTLGYLDPVYLHMGVLTKESDVYSFGVVLVEVLCGRLCFGSSGDGRFTSLVYSWKKSYANKKLEELIFQDLNPPMDPTCLETFSNIAFRCLHEYREERPSMSHVVEKLEIAYNFQKPFDPKQPHDYENILEAAVEPLVYKSAHELNALLSKGILLNEGKTWFSLNDKGHHCVLISIDECLNVIKDSCQYSSNYNSRFKVGTYHPKPCFQLISINVRCEFLTPGIKYMVNLVFKLPDLLKKKPAKQQYVAFIYRLNGKNGRSIVYIQNNREDEWLIARLYQFSTTNNQSSSLDFSFDYNQDMGCNLQVKMGHDDQVVLDQFKEILEAADPPLFYTSIDELKFLLSKGVLLNKETTWFYLNDKGQHCEMISVAECVEKRDHKYYSHHYNSRFLCGLSLQYTTLRTRVRTQFLSPHIAYTVNLVFTPFVNHETIVKQYPLVLTYKLDGETTSCISYLASWREDNWWMIELCRFISEGKTIDLQIDFEELNDWIIVEGIEFQPLKEDTKHHVLEDETKKEADIQPPISDLDDTYWEQKLPNDYQDMIKRSKDGLVWTTKKELYSILRAGFLINDGKQWFFLDKNGKICQMLSAKEFRNYGWRFLPLLESRFGEAYVVDTISIHMNTNIISQDLSPQTSYACYLVYKLPQDQSIIKNPVEVSFKEDRNDLWYIFLVSPPETPVIRAKGNQNTHNLVNSSRKNAIPQERSDGWMEVQIWKFQTTTTTEMIPMDLSLIEMSRRYVFKGLILQGIEFRPI